MNPEHLKTNKYGDEPIYKNVDDSNIQINWRKLNASGILTTLELMFLHELLNKVEKESR